MKVAVCYSGLYRHFDGWKENHKVITNLADRVLYTTWMGNPKPEGVHSVVFPEPMITYNCYQTENLRINHPSCYKNHHSNPAWPWMTKQVLGHQLACDYLDDSYDIIIRMRYDTSVGQAHDWASLIKESYEHDRVISFGSWGGSQDKNKNHRNELYLAEKDNSKMWRSMVDFMNIHPKYKMRRGHAIELDKKKELRPANLGFYQVLCEPWPNPEDRKNYGGGVGLTRYMQDTLHHVPGGI